MIEAPLKAPTQGASPREVRATYWLGDVVYLKVRAEKVAGMITAVTIRSNGVLYMVTWGNTASESGHYGFELATEYEPDFQA